MSLQTGGRAVGATSTRSRSASCASFSAWSVGTIPTVSPLGPTSRTSGTRIRSLILSSVLMGPPCGRVVGDLRREPGNTKRPPPWQAKASHDDTPPGSDATRRARHRAVLPGPDPTTWTVGAGGRRGLRLSDLVGLNQRRVPDIPPGPHS